MLVAVGLGRGGAVAGSLVLAFYLNGGIQLDVGYSVGSQLSGADVPCALILIVLSALYFLDAVLGYFVQEGILVSSDVQVAGAVGSRLGIPGDEVDVSLREQVSNLLVELQGVAEVQSALALSVEGEPSILVRAEVQGNFLSIVGELYSAVLVSLEGVLVFYDTGLVVVLYTVGQSEVDTSLVLLVLSLVLAGAQVQRPATSSSLVLSLSLVLISTQ